MTKRLKRFQAWRVVAQFMVWGPYLGQFYQFDFTRGSNSAVVDIAALAKTTGHRFPDLDKWQRRLLLVWDFSLQQYVLMLSNA